jgi:hypothetical protein
VLAVVTAALTTPVSLLVGSVVFYARASMGWVDPGSGFEPNLFLRHFGLPLSAVVFAGTFAVALWRKRKEVGSSGDGEIGSSGDRVIGRTGKPTTAKAAAIAGIFAVGLAAMVFVPVWFVLAFISRLATGEIHRATFVLAGAGAAAFMVWVFRLAFGYFRKGVGQPRPL